MTALRAPLILVGLSLVAAPSLDAPVRCPKDPCGTAVIITRALPQSLFPPTFASAGDHAVGELLFLKLASIGPALNTVGDSGFIPQLASSWRFESPLRLTFRLDPRARWQDGVPVTAQDVVFTFDVYRDTLVNSPARPLLEEISGVTARDDHTVTFQFRSTYPEQLYDATHQMEIIPRHLFDSIPRARLAAHPLARTPVGDGPYRLVSWKEGETVELAADSAFFLARPGLARLIWRFTPDYSTAIAQLLAGEADIMEFLGPPENVEQVRPSKEVRVIEYPTTTFVFLDLNLKNPDDLAKPHPLFGDRNVRRALVQAIDRRLASETAYGRYATLAVGPVSGALAAGRDTTIPQLAYDPAAARRTLAAAGWKDSDGDGILDQNGQKFEFEILYPVSSVTRQRAAVVIKDQLRRVGVSVVLTGIDFNLFLSRTGDRHFHAAMMNWNDDPTPSGIRQSFTTSGIGRSNYRGYSNPEFDRLVAAATAAPDPATSRTRWRAAYALINQDAPAVWLAAPISVAAVSRRFQNVFLRPDQWAATLWTWRVAPGQTIPRDLVEPGPSSGPR